MFGSRYVSQDKDNWFQWYIEKNQRLDAIIQENWWIKQVLLWI